MAVCLIMQKNSKTRIKAKQAKRAVYKIPINFFMRK